MYFVPDADVPGPPKDLRVTDITRSTMRLIWKLPDNDGGERIKSYYIEKKCVTDKAWTKVNSLLDQVIKVSLFQIRFHLMIPFHYKLVCNPLTVQV